MSDELDHLLDAAGNNKPGKRVGWPKLPGHDADLTVIRAYLTTAANLPAGWAIDLAERHGRYGSDPLTITVRTPGDAQNIDVRFDSQRDCSKPAALRGAFFEATNGASRMRYPTSAQASDFYGMVCALAHVASHATIADETYAWLHSYLDLAWILEGLTFKPPGRYDAVCTLQARPEFERKAAQTYVRGDLDPRDRWVAIIDAQTDELWIRTGELAAYLRHVYGTGSLAHHTLDARVSEIGGDREHVEEDRRHAGGRHISLVLYRFPSVQAFPTITRDV